MFGIFRRCPIDKDMADWILERYDWLADTTAQIYPNNRFQLVTPTGDFFPASGLEGRAKAERLFNTVRDLMGLSEWPCRLEVQAEDIDVRVSDVFFLKHSKAGVGGTFSYDQDAVITYNPGQLQDPIALVATFAHEFSHYLLHGSGQVLPEGIEEELLTDLCAVFCGFGLFQCNSAFKYQVTNEGWSTQSLGYLSGQSLAFALALFTVRAQVPPENVLAHLKADLSKVYRKSLRYIELKGAVTVREN